MPFAIYGNVPLWLRDDGYIQVCKLTKRTSDPDRLYFDGAQFLWSITDAAHGDANYYVYAYV